MAGRFGTDRMYAVLVAATRAACRRSPTAPSARRLPGPRRIPSGATTPTKLPFWTIWAPGMCAIELASTLRTVALAGPPCAEVANRFACPRGRTGRPWSIPGTERSGYRSTSRSRSPEYRTEARVSRPPCTGSPASAAQPGHWRSRRAVPSIPEIVMLNSLPPSSCTVAHGLAAARDHAVTRQSRFATGTPSCAEASPSSACRACAAACRNGGPPIRRSRCSQPSCWPDCS